LILTKFAEVALLARNMPLHLIIFVAQVSHLLEVAVGVRGRVADVLKLRVQLAEPLIQMLLF